MIPKYIVFNTNMPDKHGNALPVGQGNNLELFRRYKTDLCKKLACI
jgi:hypothetical protein